MKNKFLIANFNGMSCVVSALVADNPIGIVREYIDDLSFPLRHPIESRIVPYLT